MFEGVQSLVDEHAALEQQLADPDLFSDQARSRRLNQRYAALTAVVKTDVVAAKIAAKPQSAEAAQAPERVTIEGCLMQQDETFQLKNTAGEDAPKGRSWKSGFLHKGAKTLEVVDPRHRLNLSKHVGERVSVSGMLDDRELQGTSLKRIAESCN